MFCLLRELKIRPLATGILSNIPGLFSWWDSHRPVGNTSSTVYARGVWRFHLENYLKFAANRMPSHVAEFGPGATLGSCIAALCDGVKRAVALDVRPYASKDSVNLEILNELTPDSNRTSNYESLRAAVTRIGPNSRGPSLQYLAPWTDLDALPANSLDLIFSHSVMEHVVSPKEAYEAFFHWLMPGGLMSHKIDHSSHAITKSWNGHYAIPDVLWSLIVGGRPYLLNRMTPAQHRHVIENAGFQILLERLEMAEENDSSSSCRSIKDRKEYQIKTSTFVCQKPLAEQ
jgi:hypothetical protein